MGEGVCDNKSRTPDGKSSRGHWECQVSALLDRVSSLGQNFFGKGVEVVPDGGFQVVTPFCVHPPQVLASRGGFTKSRDLCIAQLELSHLSNAPNERTRSSNFRLENFWGRHLVSFRFKRRYFRENLTFNSRKIYT
jgi:hypothetical protein